MPDDNATRRQQIFSMRLLGWTEGAAGKEPRAHAVPFGSAYVDGYKSGSAAREIALHEASAASEHVPDPTEVPVATEVVGYS